MRKRRSWREDEIDILAKNSEKLTLEELGLLLPERTSEAIRKRLEILGLRYKCKNARWSKEEESLLIEVYPTCREIKDIIHLFEDKTYKQIKSKIDNMRLKKKT